MVQKYFGLGAKALQREVGSQCQVVGVIYFLWRLAVAAELLSALPFSTQVSPGFGQLQRPGVALARDPGIALQ